MKKFFFGLFVVLFGFLFFAGFLWAEQIAYFAVLRSNGTRTTLGEVLNRLPKKKKIIINFTSVHCAPCRKEIPEILSIVKKHPKQVEAMFIVSESFDEIEKSAPGEKFLQLFSDAGVHYKSVLFSDMLGAAAKRVSIKETPYTFIINKSRHILLSIRAYKEDNHARILKALNK